MLYKGEKLIILSFPTLQVFMHDWAKVSRTLFSLPPNIPLPASLIPIRLIPGPELDSLASGFIDSPNPSSSLLEVSRSLPIHRYDWWNPSGASKAHSYFKQNGGKQLKRPEETIGWKGTVDDGEEMPWSKWELEATVERRGLRFEEFEIRRIWEAATGLTKAFGVDDDERKLEDQKRSVRDLKPKLKISKLDALQAHIWSCIIRARGIEKDEECYLDMSIGFRSRLGMKEDSLGSPLRLTYATATGADVIPTSTPTLKTSSSSMSAVGKTLSALSTAIRTSLSQFTKPASQALLHDLAHELSAQRLWATFLGRGNTIVTSWCRLGVWDVDFVGGGPEGDGNGRPCLVDAWMPECDGMLQVMVSDLVGPQSHGKARKSMLL